MITHLRNSMCLFCVPNNFSPSSYSSSCYYFFVSSPIAILDERYVVCVCVYAFALLIYGTIWYLYACCYYHGAGGNGDDGFSVCRVYPRSFFAYILHIKKPHHSVDRLIFRSNSPFLFSFIFQNVCMDTRVQCGTMKAHLLAFDIFIVLPSTYLHGLRRKLWVLSLFSPSAYRICFIIFLFGQTQLHKCNANIFFFGRNKQPMKTYGWRLFLFHSRFLCAIHFVRLFLSSSWLSLLFTVCDAMLVYPEGSEMFNITAH